MSANVPNNLEAFINSVDWHRQSPLTGGIVDVQTLPDLASWAKTDYATPIAYSLSTSAPVAGVSAGGSNEMRVIRFGEAATTSTNLRVMTHLPASKRVWSADPKKSGVMLVLKARQVITGGTPTYDSALGLSARATFFSPTLVDTGSRNSTSKLFDAESAGTGFVTSTLENAFPPGIVADSAPSGFRLLSYDLFNGLTAAQKGAIGPFTSVSLTIAPTKTLAANYGLDIAGGWLVFHRHIAPFRWLDTILRNLA